MGAVGYAGYARPADLGNGVVSDQVADMIRQFPAVTSLPAGAWRPGISAVSAAALRLGIRALVFAADHQRLEVIDQLIAVGTPVNEADAEWGRLPLHTAAASGRPASVRRLLAHGADPSLRDTGNGRTPLEECQPGNRYLDSPAHDEVDTILRPLTQTGTHGHQPIDKQARSPE